MNRQRRWSHLVLIVEEVIQFHSRQFHVLKSLYSLLNDSAQFNWWPRVDLKSIVSARS